MPHIEHRRAGAQEETGRQGGIGRSLTPPPFVLPLLPKGGEGRGEEADYSSSNPLAPALSPLGRGEGVGGSAKLRPTEFHGWGLDDRKVDSFSQNAVDKQTGPRCPPSAVALLRRTGRTAINSGGAACLVEVERRRTAPPCHPNDVIISPASGRTARCAPSPSQGSPCWWRN